VIANGILESTQINMPTERLARDKTLKEQALLKEDREKIWITVSAFDMNVATALKRNLEVSAAAIEQVQKYFLFWLLWWS
jgi:hypothetical protein